MVRPPEVRRPPWAVLALVVLAGALVLVALLLVVGRPWGSTPSRLGHAEVGPDPFLAVAIPDTPGELQPLLSDATARAEAAAREAADDATGRARARADAATQPFEDEGIGLVRPATLAAPAVVPGDPDELCAIDELLAGFRADPAAAEAFASVHDIDVIGISEYLEAMRAGYLTDDLEVINHRFRNGRAEPYVTVLEAGTAVLVDDDGVPRVRCRCGNPLLPVQVELDGDLVDAALFADRLVEAKIGPDVPDEVDRNVDGRFTNDGTRALGPPDEVSVSLGEDPTASLDRCRYHVTVAFDDNVLIDGPGDDLRVVERGRSESTFVAIGNTVDDLRTVGEIPGGESSIDIAPVADPDETFTMVRLCDGPDQASEVPGSDIDAVLALHLHRK
ncbi:MAG: DUF6777 domain-containing protein [Actinomycetota bacterium]